MGNYVISSGQRLSNTGFGQGDAISILSGGIGINNAMASGASESILSGGIASATQVLSGAHEYVYTGGLAISGAVWSGGLQLVSGGIASATVVSAGGSETVVSGQSVATTIFGDELVDGAAATAVATLVQYGGQLNLLSGGVGSGSHILSRGLEYVEGGGIDRGSVVSSGGFIDVLSGGITNGDIIQSGGHIVVSAGGSAVGTTVMSGGILEFQAAVVSAGQTLTSVSLLSGTDSATVLSGGTAVSTSVSSGTYLYVSGGTTSHTVVAAGGSENIYSGVASGTSLTGSGAQQNVYGGSTVGTVLTNSAFENIRSGGQSISTTVGSNTKLNIYAGGSAIATSVTAGGLINVMGASSGSLIGYEGSQEINSGAVDISSTVLNGGVESVAVGGYASGTIVESGGVLTDQYYVISATVMSGGEIDAFGTVRPSYTTLLSGGRIDLISSAFVSGATATLDASTDILTVVEGGVSTQLYMAGSYANESFAVTNDFATGSVISIAGNSIAGTVAAQTTTSENAVEAFNQASVHDTNPGATDVLTITLSGAGGALIGNGLSGTNGVYKLSGTAAAITQALESLIFVPNTGQPNTSGTTTFTLSDASSVGTTVVDAATTVINTDPGVAPAISGTQSGQKTSSEVAIKPFVGAAVVDPNGSAIDTLTITLSGHSGTLNGTGLSGGTNGVYTLTGTAAAVTSAMNALVFVPGAGQPNTQSTTTFSLSDISSVYPGAVTDAKTSVTDIDPAVAPAISGTVAAQSTTSEAAIKPFAAVSLSDGNTGSTETLTITLTGAGGSLTGTGVTGGTNGVYTLTGTASAVTTALRGLSFTPTAGAPGTTSTTTFSLSDTSSAGTTVSNSTTTVIDTDPAKPPTITGASPVAQQTTAETVVKPFAIVTITDPNGGATDTLTLSITSGGGQLFGGSGYTVGADGSLTFKGTASLISSELQSLSFRSSPANPNGTEVTTFKLTDTSSATSTTVTNTAIAVSDSDPAVASTITGTVGGQTTTSEASTTPFSNVTVSDINVGNPTDILTITLSGNGGTLKDASGYSGLTSSGSNTYQLVGNANSVSQELRGLQFTPNVPPVGASATTTFSLSDVSTANTTAAMDTATTVTDVPTRNVSLNFGALTGSVSTQYAAQGVSFSLQYGNGSTGIPHVGTAGFSGGISNTSSGQYPTSADLDINFSAPANNVSFVFDNKGNNPASIFTVVTTSGTFTGSLNGSSTQSSFGTISLPESNVLSIQLSNGGSASWEFTLGSLSYSMSAPTGHAEDGYIVGGTVGYTSGNGVIDGSQPTTTTNSTGSFVIGGGTGALILTGGTDSSTGLAFSGIMEAPVGSTVLSPLTTLVEAVMSQQNVSAVAATQAVDQAMGLSTTTNLLTLDVVAGAQSGDAVSTAAFQAGSSLQDVLTLIQAAGGSESGVINSLANNIYSGGVNFASQSSVAALAASAGLLTDAANSIGSIVSATANALAAQLSAAPTPSDAFNDITGASIAQQGTAASSIATAFANNQSLSTVADSYSQNLDTTLATLDETAASNNTACYLRGTRLLTPKGYVKIENLSIGDAVTAADGQSRTVRWLGFRTLDCERHPDPTAAWPICIRAGAFSDALPLRDLWLSPGHSVVVGGVLIQAQNLINGATIIQVRRSRVQYWHVELDRHEVIVAEGMDSESYLDTGNRSAFINGGAFVDAHPDFRPRHWSDTCLPLVLSGSLVVEAREALRIRAMSMGHQLVNEPDLHALVDGRRIDPIKVGSQVAFDIPPGSFAVELCCRPYVPAHVHINSQDHRELGVCVNRIEFDGIEVALDNSSVLMQGWHNYEKNDFGGHRWCKPHVPVTASTKRVVLDLCGPTYHWALPDQLDLNWAPEECDRFG